MKIWTLSSDNRHSGTSCMVRLGEADVYESYIEMAVGDDDEERPRFDKLFAEAKESDDFSELDEALDNYRDVMDTYSVESHDILLPLAIVTLSENGNEVAVNPAELPVRILNLDNLQEDLDSAEGGDNPDDFDCLLPEELTYLEAEQPVLWKRLQPFLEEKDSLAHRYNPDFCAKCGGDCQYDSDGNPKM